LFGLKLQELFSRKNIDFESFTEYPQQCKKKFKKYFCQAAGNLIFCRQALWFERVTAFFYGEYVWRH
jgi:hypothetical protein